MSRVSSSSSGGAVKIQDSNGSSITATDGALNVNVVSNTGVSSTTISNFYQTTGTAQNATSTLFVYTVPTGVSLYLNKVLISTDSISSFDLQFNSVTNARKRIGYTQFNETFDYSLNGNVGGYKLVSGTTITLVATNLSPSGTASFNATLQGVQE